MLVKIDYQYSQNGHKKKSHDYYIYNFLRKKSSKAAGLSQRLWLFATLSQAKALAGPAPLAWLGLAQTGPAWPGFRLKAGLGTSLLEFEREEIGSSGFKGDRQSSLQYILVF
jgi:hypothetical protein